MGVEEQSKKLNIGKNITYSVFAQVISLAVSFVIGFLVPKFIDEIQYAYWQIFALYVGYVGVLQFGILDGIVLRYGQYDYEDIPKRLFSSQFKLLLSLLTVIDIVIVSVGKIFLDDMTYTIIVLVCLGIFSKNTFAYVTYLLQITNRIKKYTFVVITQRVVHGLVVSILLLIKSNNYVLYCLSDLIGDAAAIAIGVLYNKGCFFSKSVPVNDAFNEAKLNIAAGILLMVANWSSMMIVGGAKMFIQWNWDALSFGKVSFAFSISNLFLTFASAISVVLFPSLKRIDSSELPRLYTELNQMLSPALFFILVFFFPGRWILGLWLPKYSVSLKYLGLMLPSVIYISKVSLLTNNYLKAYRKEKQLLYVNLITVTLALLCFAISTFVFHSMEAVLLSIVMVVYVRFVISDRIVLKEIQQHRSSEYITEAALTLVFIAAASYHGFDVGFFIYLASLAIYILLIKKKSSRISTSSGRPKP